MANPRATIDFTDIWGPTATYIADGVEIVYSATALNGSAKVGLAMTLSGNGTISTAADGEAVIGKLLKVEADGKCTVQTDGYMKLPAGTAAALTPGKRIVGALLAAAEGYIREVATGTAAELGRQGGVIHDASVTTAVVVKF